MEVVCRSVEAFDFAEEVFPEASHGIDTVKTYYKPRTDSQKKTSSSRSIRRFFQAGPGNLQTDERSVWGVPAPQLQQGFPWTAWLLVTVGLGFRV